jgi:hypothetical protein
VGRLLGPKEGTLVEGVIDGLLLGDDVMGTIVGDAL